MIVFRLYKAHLPIILTMFLYIILYLIRFNQPVWNYEINLFQPQREYLDSLIQSLLPSPQSDLLSGILLGKKKDLPIGLNLALRDTSTLHIVVVSGQNLSFLAGLFLSLSGLIKRKIAIIISFLAIIFYTLLTGAQIPVLRALAMSSLALLAQMLGRDKESKWILTISAALMLLINPTWLFEISFQLSFLATFGVMIVGPVFFKYFKKLPLIGENLAMTLGAQLMVTPIILSNFHQLSLVSLFSNILVLWTIPYIMVIGSLMLLVTVIWNSLGKILAFVVGLFLIYFIYIVEYFASLSWSWIYIGDYGLLFWVAYYFFLAAILISINKKSPKEKSADGYLKKI